MLTVGATETITAMQDQSANIGSVDVMQLHEPPRAAVFGDFTATGPT